MGKASLAQEKRDMLFEEIYGVWTERRLTGYGPEGWFWGKVTATV